MWTFLKEQKFFLFELLIILKYISFYAPQLASSMLIQDKICLLHYNQEPHFCQNLQKQMDTAAEQEIADQILAETARFNNYKSLIETLPLLLWALFLGPFLDTYPNASFIVFLANLLGDCIAAFINLAAIYFYKTSPYYLLVASASVLFTGGTMSFGTTAALFITTNSKESSRGIKFVALEIIIIIGISGSTFISGRFLKENFNGLQLRTYHYNYLFGLALILLNFGVLFGLYQLSKSQKKMAASAEIEVETTEPKPNALKTFLSIDNARQTLHAFFRPRPQHVRLQILLLCFVQFSQMAISSGLSNLMVQFAQKVYNWSPPTYATYSAVQLFSGMLMLAAMSGIFITWLKLSDSNLIMMAQISNFLADLIRGTFLSPIAYFVSIPVGCLNGFGIVSAKAKFSKIVPKDEAGKIFTLNALIEGVVPLGTSLIYTNIFSLSISTYPGLIYHFSCAVMILTVIALIVEKRFCPVTGQETGGDAVSGAKAPLDDESPSTI